MADLTEKRTQIYLTADQHRRALAMARRRGTSLAGVVREALARYLTAAVDETSWEADPVLALVGRIPLSATARRGSLDDDIDAAVYLETRSRGARLETRSRGARLETRSRGAR